MTEPQKRRRGGGERIFPVSHQHAENYSEEASWKVHSGPRGPAAEDRPPGLSDCTGAPRGCGPGQSAPPPCRAPGRRDRVRADTKAGLQNPIKVRGNGCKLGFLYGSHGSMQVSQVGRGSEKRGWGDERCYPFSFQAPSQPEETCALSLNPTWHRAVKTINEGTSENSTPTSENNSYGL